jgi:vacuolar-type H+-ATPase subunit H
LDVFKLLDEMEELIQSSKKIPINGKIMISEEVLLDYLDRIRTMLPEEIHQAKWLSKERERMIEEAREEAEKLLQSASEEMKRLTSESELTKRAQAAAEELMAQAKRISRDIKSGASEYADNILGRLEEKLDQNLTTIRKAREELGQMK